MADDKSRDDEDRDEDKDESADDEKAGKGKSGGKDKSDADDKKRGKPGGGDDDSDDDDSGDDNESDDDEDDDKPKKPPLYKRPLFWIILVVVLAVLIIGGTLYYLHARQYESTDDAFIDTHLVRIAPEVSGLIIDIPAEDNRHVEAGTLLAVIKPAGPEAQLAEAKAGVFQAQAQVKQAEAQVAQAQANYRQSLAQIPGPEAQAEKAKRDLDRYLALNRIDKEAVAQQQIDQARATYRDQAAQAEATRKAAQASASQIAVARKQVQAANAQVLAARARVAQANVTVADLRLVAPVSGQIVNRNVNLGSYVGPGQQLMAIVPDKLWVTANFKETQITHMAVGEPVDIKVDAFPAVHFQGHVDSIQRGAGQAFALLPPQNATGNYVKVVQRVPVRILFDSPDPRRWALGPGMSVEPTVKVLCRSSHQHPNRGC